MGFLAVCILLFIILFIYVQNRDNKQSDDSSFAEIPKNTPENSESFRTKGKIDLMENSRIITQFCRRCGAKIPGDSLFCPKCGAKVVSAPTEYEFPMRSSPLVKTANVPKPIHKKTKHTFFDNVVAVIGGIMLICSAFFLACLILIPKQTPRSKTNAEVATAPPVAATTTPTVPKETLRPHGRPESGSISIGRPYDNVGDSEITIHASSKNCVVKLRTTDGITILSFFVRANETATVGVPAKKLYAYFAEGDTWYGWSDYFGEETSYSKDPDPIDFSQYTIEYTLYDVYNGNLNLSRIDEDEF